MRKKLINRIENDYSKPLSLIQLLNIKAKKPIILNAQTMRDKKNFYKSENKLALEGAKLIEEANINFEKNINIYNHNKEENELFSKIFKQFKSREIKNKEEKVKKYQFTFGDLLKSYENKRGNFEITFLYKNIFNKSGILLRKQQLIEDYFSDEVKKEGNKSKKIVKYKNFLNKLLTETKKRLFIQFPPTQKMLEEEKQKKEENIKKEELEECLKKQKEIEKLISENNLLKKLIKENKENLQAKNISTIIEKKNNKEDNDIELYSNISSEMSSSYNEKDKLKDKNKENNIENIEYNNISIIKKINKKQEKPNKESVNHPKTSRTILNKNINYISDIIKLKLDENSRNVSSLPNIQIKNDKLRKTASFNNNISSNIKTIEKELFKSVINHKKKYKNNEIFPNCVQIKNQRKSNLKSDKLIYSLNNSTKSLIKNQIIKNNYSIPNFRPLMKSQIMTKSVSNISSMKDIYKNIKKQDISSRNNKINKILKIFYGNTKDSFDYKKNGIRIFNHLEKIKEKIIENEKNDTIYVKRKSLLSDEIKKNIHLNKHLNELLKNRPAYFIGKICDTKIRLDKNKK